MDIKFKGDIDLFVPLVEEVCREALSKQGFSNCIGEVETVGKKGDNYTASVKRIIVQQYGVNNDKPLKMIVKVAPTIEEVRQSMNTKTAFNNENIVYEEIFTKFEALENKYDIPIKDRLKHPKCFAIQREEPNEVIILEDITTLGFELWSRFKSMTDVHIKLALQDLAKYHALSYALKEKDPKFYADLNERLKNIWVESQDSPDLTQLVDFLEADVQGALVTEDHKTRTKGLISNLLNDAVTTYNNDRKSRHSTIIQGDCWTNNMMFLNQNDKPVSIMMLDYQLSRVASPAADFFYLTLNCTDYETRKTHFSDWIDYYHDKLEEFLFNFDLKAKLIYPKDKFEADLKGNAKLSLGISFILGNMLVREPEDVVDFKEEKTMNPSMFAIDESRVEIIEKYHAKLNGLVQTCVDFGYI